MMNDILTKYFESGVIEKIASSVDAIAFDRFSVEKMGIDQKLLMENAGKAVADFVIALLKRNHSEKTNIILLAGPGHNGADALVAARHLISQNLDVAVYLVDKKCSEAVKDQKILLDRICKEKNNNCFVKWWSETDSTIQISNKTIFVDGIFGAGLNRAPVGIPLEIIRLINTLRLNNPAICNVVSIDVPSGLSLEAQVPLGECIHADHTITFGFFKRAHISEPSKIHCGKIHRRDIGLFEKNDVKNFFVSKQRALSRLFVPIKKNCHKGEFGHVLIYEGHGQFKGASRIAARAALRAGAGLVTIASASGLPSAYDIPEFMQGKRSDLGPDFFKKIDVLVVGPGLSKDAQLFFEALSFLKEQARLVNTVVIDADGLTMLVDQRAHLKDKFIIATPHAKEAGDLLGLSTREVEKDRFLAIDQLGALSCNKNNQIVWVLKGATTLVRGQTREIFAFRGDLPILSTGGSGDMLSGLIAGLIKQTTCPLDAALLAVSLQIEAAAQLSKKIVKGSLITELCDVIPALSKERKIIDHVD